MSRVTIRLVATALLVTAASVPGRAGWDGQGSQPQQTAEPQARPDLVRQPYSQADVDFMRA